MDNEICDIIATIIMEKQEKTKPDLDHKFG